MSDIEVNALFDLSIQDNIQNLFREEEEGEEICQELVQPDYLGSLVCNEDQLYNVSQLVDQVEQPSLGSSSPWRSAEVEQALQPSLHKSWAEEMEDKEMALLEPSLEVKQGQGSSNLLHSNVEVCEDTSMDGVEPVPPQPEPSVQDLAQEARQKASYQATLNCFSGRGSRPQQPDNTLVLEWVATL